MPRDGSGIYHRPPGTDGIPNTTIASAPYNADVADVETDLNTPRPIVAGGTGASSADAALTALTAEKNNQIVTNFDAQPWISGSFSCATTATGSPVAGHRFAGTVIVAGPNDILVQARDLDDTADPGMVYVRQKNAGVWGSWLGGAAAQYLAKAGDTMTGDLVITKANPQLFLNKAASGQGAWVSGSTNNLARWTIQLGDGAPETGGNVGSNFVVTRCNDAGVAMDAPFSIARSTGISNFSTINVPVGASNGAYQIGTINVLFGNSGVITHADDTATGCLFLQSNGFNIYRNTNHTFQTRAGGTSSTITVGSQVVGVGSQSGYAAEIKISHTAGNAAIIYRPSSDGQWFAGFCNASDGVVGSITCSATATAYNTSSDGRLKEDFREVDSGRLIDHTRVYDFAWKTSKARACGVIGQEAAEVYPGAVTYNEASDTWAVDYSKYVPVLLAELKALRARVAMLEREKGSDIRGNF